MDDLEDADRDIINVRNLLVHRNASSALQQRFPGHVDDEDDIEDILELDDDLLDAAGAPGDEEGCVVGVSDTVISEGSEGYKGLRAHELMEAKDQLLVETSDMLHVPLFTAEALLRHYGASADAQLLLSSFIIYNFTVCVRFESIVRSVP